MFRFLFPRLTGSAGRGAALFGAVAAEARRPGWYRDGGLPDTVDGRFAVLATLLALTMLELERRADGLDDASVAVVERFVEAMDAEHRQMGLSDPALGKRVRKLVSALAARLDQMRTASEGGEIEAAISISLYGDGAAVDAASQRTAFGMIRAFAANLDRSSDSALVAGQWE